MAVLKSTDNGASWIKKLLSAEAGAVYSLAVNQSDKNIIFAGGFSNKPNDYNSYSRVFKTTDGGNNWFETGSSTFGKTAGEIIYEIIIDPFNQNKIYAASSGGIFTSLDGGSTWANPIINTEVKCLAADPAVNGTLFAAGNSGVRKSTNSGSTWTTINMGLFTNDVRSLVYDNVNQILYAGLRGGGVYRYRLNPVAIEDHKILPAGFVLNQNYPNPFNPTTQIEISLPESGFYSLKVFNSLGQEAAVLFNSDLSAGTHTFTFNARDLAAGVYYYWLTGGKINLSKKMVLIK